VHESDSDAHVAELETAYGLTFSSFHYVCDDSRKNDYRFITKSPLLVRCEEGREDLLDVLTTENIVVGKVQKVKKQGTTVILVYLCDAADYQNYTEELKVS
jgi:hypothetical protein